MDMSFVPEFVVQTGHLFYLQMKKCYCSEMMTGVLAKSIEG